MKPSAINVNLQRQLQTKTAQGRNGWEYVREENELAVNETALLICDMWDRHWSKGAEERASAMAPRINETVKATRAKGLKIIHAPSETMPFYANHPARKKMLETNLLHPPKPKDVEDAPLPVDSSDGGSDTGESVPAAVWSRQTPMIEIDGERDVIAGDEGELIYSYLKQNGIRNLIYMGVHTNMCILDRSFGIKRMTRWGISCVLVRDLTDAMYNPARPPYVSHDEGTRLVVGYIEKFWCPTLESAVLMKSLKQ